MKIAYVVIALIALGIIGGLLLGSSGTASGPLGGSPSATSTASAGAYTVDPSASTVKFAGSKPLIPNYVDSGTIGIKEGTIAVAGASGTGTIVMDMGTVSVGSTPKAGMESALTEHLKKSDFFDVATYPTATFEITSVTARGDTAQTSAYDITGKLTMKGKTNEVSFPATIVLQDGKLVADAGFVIDRTKWGITFGSKDFFASIGNNAISNDVALTLHLVANPS